jgi:alkanesulfonate monooxygenase SsuD/methylene tetrahydromethanopterin reductase-like flavin-dependent oxidoreductase (luciferase family)
MRFGLVATDPAWVADELEALDASGFDALYVVDHPAFPTADAWTWLAFAAARTARIRLGTHVTGAPFHHPTRLAKQVATVDVLSGGRAILGIGSGYEHQDFEPYGFRMLPFGERTEQLEEMLALLVSLWTSERTELVGKHYQLLGGAAFEPKPRQSPHPPLVLGLNRPGPLLDVAARRAQAINTWQLGPDQVAALSEPLTRACDACQRDPATLEVTCDVLLARGADRGGAEQLAWRIRDMARSWGRAPSVTDWGSGGVLHGNADDMLAQIDAFRAAGACEIAVSVFGADDARWFSDAVIARAAAS